LPHCVVCKTEAAVELDKDGRFKCPDHRGTLEEIQEKIPFTDPLPELEPLLTFLNGGVPRFPDRTSDVQKAEVTREYLRREREKKEASRFRIPSQRDISSSEVQLRYG
jgi:hypothetical protein